MPRGDCDKFFNAVISLFRRAHQIQKTRDGVASLAVCDVYQEEWAVISELWFLGMQGKTTGHIVSSLHLEWLNHTLFVVMAS